MANNLAYYIRLSLADDDVGDSNKDESNSVKNQRDLILSYIDSHPEFKGWTVHEFIDDGFTGTNDDRPDFQRLIDLTWQGQIQCIIVKDHSRFARNYIITGNYLEQVFPLLGVRFIAINDNYDSARNQSVEDNMNLVLKSVLNTYYSKDLSRKITASFVQRMRQGTYKAAAPFGYVRRKEAIAFEIDSKAAEIVRKIFTLALAGKERKEIANLLNEEGLPTPAVYNARYHNGAHNQSRTALAHALWEPTMLLPILRNPVYCGDRILRKNVSVTPGSKKRRPARPEEQFFIKDAHAPIVSRKDFEAVQKMLPAKKVGGHRKKSLDYPLKGAVRCGTCRRSMTRAKNYSVFVCSHAKMEHSQCPKKDFPIAEIEQVVFASLKPLLQIAASAGRHLQKRGTKASAEAFLLDVIVLDQLQNQFHLAGQFAGWLKSPEGKCSVSDCLDRLEKDLEEARQEQDTLSMQRARIFEAFAESLLDKDSYLQGLEQIREKSLTASLTMENTIKERDILRKAASLSNPWLVLFTAASAPVRLDETITHCLIDRIDLAESWQVTIHFKEENWFLRLQNLYETTHPQAES